MQIICCKLAPNAGPVVAACLIHVGHFSIEPTAALKAGRDFKPVLDDGSLHSALEIWS